MWPYAGKKTRRSCLELNACNPYAITPRPGDLNGEYFNKINSSVRNFSYFPSYQVDNDGRVLKNQGPEPKDITNEICILQPADRREECQGKPASKQLHNRNVTQLKYALGMPANQRRVSLTHITGAIIRNEVAPTLTQLQDVDFVRTNLSKEYKLPPLRRHYIHKAKSLQNTVTVAQRRGPSIGTLVSKTDTHNLSLYLPTLQNTLSKANQSDDQTVVDVPVGKKSKGHQHSRGQSDKLKVEEHDTDKKVYETAMATGLRSDSISNEISDQFKQIILMSKVRAEETDKSQAQAIRIAGKVSDEEDFKHMYTNSGLQSYKRRHEYGKNLERNWFKSFMQKQKKKPKNKESNVDNTYDMRLDIFYSPEPDSDEEYDDTEGDTYDDTSMMCGGYSTKEHRFKRQHSFNGTTLGELPDENGVNTDDELSSGSDIEIILKDDQLIQRKTKHKMKKKRKRQLERYKAFMPVTMETVTEVKEDKEVTLTDQEIRAIRLNLRNKERLKKLKGKRKFLQAANAVYIAVQFKNILQKIRKRKLKEMKRRQLKIAAMITKRARLKERANNEEEYETSPTLQPSLKETFMDTIGNKLIYDVGRLCLTNNVEEDETGDDECAENNSNIDETRPPAKMTKTRNISRYEKELQKVSHRDIETAFPSRKRPEKWRRRRRNSNPVSVKPDEFVLEVREKSKRRSKDKKPAKRFPSPPPIRKCACPRHRSQYEQGNHALVCQHQQELRKPKTTMITIPTTGLMRTYSLEDLSKKTPIELRDLLQGIDIPAKEVKLEILARKFRRQRKKRQQIRLDAYVTPAEVIDQRSEESDSDIGSIGSDVSDMSDYDFIYGGPFVGSGVMWNQNSNKKPKTWTAQDVERELKKITRLYHDMKDCSYLRLDEFNQAILGRLRENSI